MTISWNFNRLYTLEEWEKIIEDWEMSRMTKRAYCKRHKLVYSTFCLWEKKIHPSTTLTHQEMKERWRKIVKNWEKSGLSKYAYCFEKGLNTSLLRQWEKKFSPQYFLISRALPKELQIENLQEHVNSTFLEVDISTGGQRIEVTLSQGEHFCLEGPFDWQKLNAWLTPLLMR